MFHCILSSLHHDGWIGRDYGTVWSGMSPKWPRQLDGGRYELIEPVGTGGMATVFRAMDRQRRTECAVKLLLPSAARSAKTRRRFVSEATTMAALDHPNVVRVQRVGRDEAHFYFVMELARGGSVADYLRRHGARGPREALDLVFQVLQGLDYAHAAGVVHRDIKPHNMLLSEPPDPPSGAPQRVKLTDFGIAKHMVMGPGARITGTGDTLGTLAYMAPEQRSDPRQALPASDLYGVGATLYILLTGRRPFDLAVAPDDPTVMARLPAPLRPLVERATAHDPADAIPRPGTWPRRSPGCGARSIPPWSMAPP